MARTYDAGPRTFRRAAALAILAGVLGAGALPALEPATPALAHDRSICWNGRIVQPYDAGEGLQDGPDHHQRYDDWLRAHPGAYPMGETEPPCATPTTPPAATATPLPTATPTTPPPPPPPPPADAPPTRTPAPPPATATPAGTVPPQPTGTGVPQDEPKPSGPDQTVIWVCLQRPPSAENPTGRMEFPIKRDESGRYRDQWVNFDARGYPIEGPCPAPASATATATRVPPTATRVPPAPTTQPTAQPTVVAGTPLLVREEPAEVSEVSEVIVVEATPAVIVAAPVATADLYCLVNADLPECRPSTQTSGLGRG